MNTKTILVTGAAGFIGSSLCERLVETCEVIGIDNFDPFYSRTLKMQNLNGLLKNSHFTFRELDLLDGETLSGLMAERRPECVVHLAAKAGVRPSIQDPQGYARVNVEGTAAVLEACRRAGVGQVVYGSSSSVYGGLNTVPFREDMNTDRQVSPYAATKKAGELLCATYSALYGQRTAALRFFTVYGPRQRPDLAIAKFTALIRSGKAIPVYGDGASGRDYTFIDDIVSAVARAVDWTETSPPATFDVFNIGENHVTTLSGLIQLIEEAVGMKAVIERLPEQPGDMRDTWADIEKAQKVLQYAPSTRIEDGIARYVATMKDQNG